MVLVSIVILLFSVDTVFGRQNAVGEKNFEHYYGPRDPHFGIGQNNQIFFQDEIIKRQSIEKTIEAELFELQSFFSQEFSLATSCPNENYQESYDYMRFLARLLTMSYLFEALQRYQYTAAQFSSPASCAIDWKKFVRTCQPKTNEMKTFLKNSARLVGDSNPISIPSDQSKPSTLRAWVASIKDSDELVPMRLRQYCSHNKCEMFSNKTIPKLLGQACTQDQKLMREICSEKDHLYGISYVPELYALVVRSNALKVFENEDIAASCLQRFILSGKRFENPSMQLRIIYSYFFSENKKSKKFVERGRLFPMGALREFNKKGLTNIFKAKKDKKPEVSKNAADKPTKLEPIEFKRIKLKKFEKKKKRVVRDAPRVTSKKKEKPPKRSSFYKASSFRLDYGLVDVDVDMGKFKFDFVFTMEQKKKYAPMVKKMSSISILRKMKQEDKMGSRKAPLPLKFLKFMIDEELHQNLFNINQVIGNTFFVKNDIDEGVERLELVEIRNDVTTQYQWQIIILESER
jgi:hypothetical protein